MKCWKMPVFGVFLIILHVLGTVRGITVDEKMREDTDLSEFYNLLEHNMVANFTLMSRHVTVFAPTNRAFQDSDRKIKDSYVLYHIANLPQTTDELKETISSEHEGNPPLWVTKVGTPPNTEIYINNAKILPGSNFKTKVFTAQGEKTQVLHKISEVLEPILPNSPESLVSYPNAFEFLNTSDSLDLGTYRLRIFRQRVMENQKQDIFKAEGGFTFFIPEEEGFKVERSSKIDHQVIDGHVIPNHVLFTAPTPNDVPYSTLANNDNFKVTISFIRDPDDPKKVYVKSNTLIGDSSHPTGVVLAKIVKPNIPVKNGVVHIIQRPLMVVDTTVKQFLESFKDDKKGPVYKFYQAMRDYGDDFIDVITRHKDITVFAPSNAAWDEEGVKHIVQDKKRFREILNLHYVQERLPLDSIKQKSISGVSTAAAKKSLYFNVVERSNGSQMVTVEGGGVNATIITANIAATNGIIHIIDRVLGIPYTTVLDKLRTDPMLNATYYLGKLPGFNQQLNDTTKRFTYFVPRNSAWEKVKTQIPSAYKKIFMPEYSYYANQVLERHLVIDGQAYSMAELRRMSINNNSVLLFPVRDNLKLRIREHNESYQIEWMGSWIQVFRPDVACTNGIIHVIDEVFIIPEDLTVTGSASVMAIAPHIMTIIIAKWFL